MNQVAIHWAIPEKDSTPPRGSWISWLCFGKIEPWISRFFFFFLDRNPSFHTDLQKHPHMYPTMANIQIFHLFSLDFQVQNNEKAYKLGTFCVTNILHGGGQNLSEIAHSALQKLFYIQPHFKNICWLTSNKSYNS